jgi:predicted helicase
MDILHRVPWVDNYLRDLVSQKSCRHSPSLCPNQLFRGYNAAMSKFNAVLTKFRKHSFSERDKGARFERLIQAYLQTDPKYKDRFQKIWLWGDFPERKSFGGGQDVGIDLVALTTSGEYWAVQCKCYQEDNTIDKETVNSFLATSSRKFTSDKLQGVNFAHRVWVSTTNKWTANAVDALQNQTPPVTRINLTDLENAEIDWQKLEDGISGDKALLQKKKPFPHQLEAIAKANAYYKIADRGKLIMACGTGKTFTALKIAEKETDGKGLVLFLVPSIALLGQTLNEWFYQADEKINAICICSDAEVSRKKTKSEDGVSISTVDLALPATTSVKDIVNQLAMANQKKHSGMTVVFSTYQSIEVIAKAQKTGKSVFDLIICDEAHRTTGVTLQDEDESAFVKVHDNNFLKAKKRLYMTATPRLYSDNSKSKAAEHNAVLCSMDDEKIYGTEFYRIGFGKAVEQNLLADYKVLILSINDDAIPKPLQKIVSNGDNEINTDDISKLVGCINGLSKRILGDEGILKKTDPEPMRRTVSFCQSIKISKKTADLFNSAKEDYYKSLDAKARSEVVAVNAGHIDGTMGATERDEKLSWLKANPDNERECRMLCNVRCLSEGVDVPSLDAVLFLSARNSQVDVVQSVGRVMRRAEGKKYGYIIIPVVVPSNVKPEEALNDNKRYAVVWTVLNALRAHDDRFNAVINKIDLNKNGGGQILLTHIGGSDSEKTQDGDGKPKIKQLQFPFEEYKDAMFARMVLKVGDRLYWEQWAKDVALIVEKHITRIDKLIQTDGKHQAAFAKFLSGLQKNINPSITVSSAIEMLAQHLITQPIFEALFENYSFAKNNPISKSMQKMITLLEKQAMDKDTEKLNEFYDSVRKRVEGINNAAGKQKIVIELYEKFFKTAFPKQVEKLGIVYTPVECVDFILKSVSYLLQKEFGRDLSDENVHILDPFTGTGTFIVRLLQNGLIRPKDLPRKYARELHANEIVLLAYYIASVNIENAYHDILNSRDYQPFDGICLTDTFQLGETDSSVLISEIFPENSERVEKQKKAPIKIIIGNPPYSAKQDSANDNAQNESYPCLEKRVAETYVANTDATNKNSIYDSYIKAFRWSSDRLGKDGGIIAFISNAGWLDGNSMDGFRKCLEQEFSSIYVFNLRGNQRTQGELSRKEGGKIFGGGSRTPISITFLVKKKE